MEEKKAFIFDTNFIVEELPNFSKIIAKLKENFIVYIPQIVIQERTSQKYIELKKQYDKLDAISEECKHIAKITFFETLDNHSSKMVQSVTDLYTKEFSPYIIPLPPKDFCLDTILNRSFKKRPPFSRDDKASDKGFKDTLLWISLLEYFKIQGENEIILVTNDKIFLNNKDFLTNEFNEVTGKSIEIKENSYYKTHSGENIQEPHTPKQEINFDLQQMREKISHATRAILGYDEDYDWGQLHYCEYFKLYKRLTSENINTIFERMEDILHEHVFDLTISAKEILEVDYRVYNAEQVPIQFWENSLQLYKMIKDNAPDFLEQFYSTVANILNENYVESDDNYFPEDIPF